MGECLMIKEKMAGLRLDYIAHWTWAILFALLALSGFAMMGARFGWMLGYSFSFADFVHRIVGTLFVLWVTLAVVYEIARTLRSDKVKMLWLPIGKKGFAGFNFLATLLIILSGFMLWFHASIPTIFGVFGLVAHEMVALVSMGSIVWHIYDKRRIL